MSTFFTPTNQGRIDKMLELIGHLETSAQSNKATADDWTQLLGPLTDKLAELTAEAEDIPAPTVKQATQTHWINGIHMAREIPIENAPAVASVLMTRIEEHFDDQRKGAK